MISLFLLVVEIRGLAYTLFLASSSAEVIRSSTLSLKVSVTPGTMLFAGVKLARMLAKDTSV